MIYYRVLSYQSLYYLNIIKNYIIIFIYKKYFFVVFISFQIFGQDGYGVGEQMSVGDQATLYNYCYPSDSLQSSFSLEEYSGKVLMIEMSTSW